MLLQSLGETLRHLDILINTVITATVLGIGKAGGRERGREEGREGESE